MSREAVIEKYQRIYESSPEKSLEWCNARDVSGCGGDTSLLRQQQEWLRTGAEASGVALDEEHGTYGTYCYRRIELLEVAISELEVE